MNCNKIKLILFFGFLNLIQVNFSMQNIEYPDFKKFFRMFILPDFYYFYFKKKDINFENENLANFINFKKINLFEIVNKSNLNKVEQNYNFIKELEKKINQNFNCKEKFYYFGKKVKANL